MVSASVKVLRDEGAIEMRVNGHADFRELGKDPVCAGASVLAVTAAQCAITMRESGRLQKKPVVNVKGGNVRVVVKPKPEHFLEALLIFGTVSTGFQLLAEAYPGNVKYYQFDTADIPAESIEKGS